MSTAQRRARHKENLRRAILDAARELFVTEDYKAVSMRRIAERIEYSPTAIYLHFKDKEDILFHLVEEGFALLSERLSALHIPDAIVRLFEGGRVYIDFALTQPHYYKLMFQVEDQSLIEKCASTKEIGEQAFSFIRKCIQDGIQQGKVDPNINGDLVSHAVWAHVHGAASLALAGRLSKLPPETHRAFFETVLAITGSGIRSLPAVEE